MAFTFGKRCSLCGGKLDSQLRCTECGLDNKKNDDMYKGLLNQNNCDDKPLTHVHEEKQAYREGRSNQQELKERLQRKYAGRTGTQSTGARNTSNYNTNTYKTNTYNTSNNRSETRQTTRKTQTKSKAGAIVGMIIAIFGILPSLLGSVLGILEESFSTFKDDLTSFEEVWMDTERIDYQYENYLSSGFYTVGVHIPEGTYDMQFDWGDYAYVELYQYVDGELFMGDFYYLDWESDFIEGVYLEEGTILKISINSGIRLSTNDDMEYAVYEAEGNSLTESYEIHDMAIAGQDFPAGVYDIYYEPSQEECANGAYGYIDYTIWDAQKQDIIMGEALYVDSYMGEVWYCNVALPEGAEIIVTDLEAVTIVPSAAVDPELLKITGNAL